MQVVDSLESIPQQSKSGILTIGNFDGVHLGHQTILRQVATLAANKDGKSIVLTFLNHPSTVLRPDSRILRIATTEHKVKLLEATSIDLLIQILFTRELSQLSTEEFLTLLCERVKCTNLILGHDARIGKDRLGDRELVQEWAQRTHVEVEYLPAMQMAGEAVSSSLIRKFIMAGQLDMVSNCLGRAYSIYGPIIPGIGLGKKLGFPTLNLDVSSLCLPPFGVYAVKVVASGGVYSGIANLGVAPTVRPSGAPLLEVHVFGDQVPSEVFVEVVLEKFIRPERKFASKEELQQQIEKDVKDCRD